MHIGSLQLRVRRRPRGINGGYMVLESVRDEINVMSRQIHEYVSTRQEEFFGRTRVVGEKDVGYQGISNLPLLQGSLGCHVGWIESSLKTTTEMDASLVGVLERALDLIRCLVHWFFSKDGDLCVSRLSNVLAMRKGGRGQNNTV